MIANLSGSKKWGLVIVLAAIILSLLSYFFITRYYQTGYTVKLGEYELGVTKDQENINEQYETILAKLTKSQEHLDYVNQPTPHFIEMNQWFLKDEEAKIVQQMNQLLQDEILAWEIIVNGESIGILDHKENAEKLLNRIKSRYSKLDGEQAAFKEEVVLKEIKTRPVRLESMNSIEAKLSSIQSPAKTYTVQEGDTIWDIALLYDLTMDELLIKNPTMGDVIQPGETVLLSPEVRKLNVLSEITIEEEQKVPFDVELVAASSGLKPRDGVEGLKKTTYLVETENGTEIERSVLSEDIIKEPISKIEVKKPKVRVASKSRAAMKNLGFIWPADGGIITSGFGMRNGRMHKGIDIAGASSLDILAANSGEVTFAGKKGDYGNLIIITHDNGLTTYYAHTKKNNVSVGDRVNAGESIGVMGETGNATGVSLHFEVRKEGKAYDPLGYVSQ